MKPQDKTPGRKIRLGKYDMGVLRGAGWMALFTARFWRELVFNRLWLGLVPVGAAAFVVMFLLNRYAAGFSVPTAMGKAFVYCLWSAFCYAIGIWSVVCRRLGIGEDGEEDGEEGEDSDGGGRFAGRWAARLLLGALALLFVGWVCWPAIGYWLWGRGDWIAAVTGPVFKIVLVASFFCPVIWNHSLEK